MRTKLFSIILACLLSLAWGVCANEAEVELNLVLAIDVSRSVSTERWNLQKRGYAAAFRDPKVIGRITSSAQGKITVVVVQWSSTWQQVRVTDWHVISGTETGELFAQELESMPRVYRYGTAIGPALLFCMDLLARAPTRARRSIIDISGDGKQDDGPRAQMPDLMLVRERVLARGITINGLALMIPSNPVESKEAREEYERLIGGRDAFMLVVEDANDYEQFVSALKHKLLREIVAER